MSQLALAHENVTWPQLKMIAESQAMKDVVSEVRKIARSRHLHVLILGETGTGKEEVARLLHETSDHLHHGGAVEPFVALNCAALPEELVNSELFGYEKGTFTGADRNKPGILETAGQGSVFLDEIGEISAGTQAKLLRFLSEREITRIGGKVVGIHSRVISATNRNLYDQMTWGRFREDLFYRLNGYIIKLIPLRERPEDIGPLAQHFLHQCQFRQEMGVSPILSADVIDLLKDQLWFGNARELRSAVEAAVINHSSGDLTCSDFSFKKSEEKSLELGWEAPRIGERLTLEEVQLRYIRGMYHKLNGNITKLSKVLGLSRGTLYRRLQAAHVDVPE
jgi:transcriptional regulator with PAS, ATPase and Fis domain